MHVHDLIIRPEVDNSNVETGINFVAAEEGPVGLQRSAARTESCLLLRHPWTSATSFQRLCIRCSGVEGSTREKPSSAQSDGEQLFGEACTKVCASTLFLIGIMFLGSKFGISNITGYVTKITFLCKCAFRLCSMDANLIPLNGGTSTAMRPHL